MGLGRACVVPECRVDRQFTQPGRRGVLRTLASMAGFWLDMTHLADSLALVDDLALAGLGSGCCQLTGTPGPAWHLLPLPDPRYCFADTP